MYHSYFGLREEPFSIAVNPKYLFMSARHRDALAHLLYGVASGGGFILLTGEVGTGKTTINRALMEQLPGETDIAVILNPALNADELLATVCDELKIDYDHGNYTLKSLTDKLHAFLLDNHSRGRNTVLLIDEAQHLQFDVLEQIRLLTNLETNTRKLLQIILVGQPELSEILSRPELRQLNQRITARYELQPLNREETESYIRHRLQVAGLPASQEIFPPRVEREIHRLAGGIPRLINVLCERVLLGAYGHNQSRADMKTLRQAAAEVLGGRKSPASAPRQNLALVAALLLGVLIAGAVYWEQTGKPARAAMETRVEAEVVEAEVVEAEVVQAGLESVEPERAEGADLADAELAPVELEPQPDSPMPESLLPAATPASAVMPGPAALWYPARWEALAGLAAHLGAGGLGDCSELSKRGFRCEELQAPTWETLLAYNRPAVLSLVNPERFAAYAVLVAVSEGQALLLYNGEEFPVPLAELGRMWRGDFMFIWQPPEFYRGPVSLGDQGPMVRWLAEEFAQLDRQTKALADETFNSALDRRVRLFQRQFQLRDDGVVGVRTLLKLSEQRGDGRSLRRPLAAAVDVESL